MRIAGLEKCSMVDYPGMLAAVVFSPGCNFDCYYCHNRSLLEDQPARGHEPEQLIAWLEKRTELLDAVVFSGGEPTLQPDLSDFMATVHGMGYAVKLDTNGARPEVLADLLDAKLLDYVAMDVKAPRDKYAEIAGTEVDLAAIDTSIDLIRRRCQDYEFRTTAVPQLTQEDILSIAEWIGEAQCYVLQQFRSLAGQELHKDKRLNRTPHSTDWFAKLRDQIAKTGHFEEVELRGVQFEAAQVA